MNKYYLYGFFDSRKPGKYTYIGLNICFLYEPFYIGKGCRDRINAHFYPSALSIKSFKNNKINSIINDGGKVIKEKIFENLTQEESFNNEILFIESIGRQDLNKGTLTNLTDGKDGSNMVLLKKRKPVLKIDINTKEIIEEYDSLTNAAKMNNGSHLSDIHKCCIGKSNTHNGYFWKFKGNYNSKFIINKKNRNILEYDYKTEKFLNEYPSIKQASLSNNINSNKISRSCSGEIKELNGKYFRYKDNNFNKIEKEKSFKKIILIEDNKEIIFKSMTECSKYLNCSTNSIWKNCKSTRILTHEVYYLSDYENQIKKDKKIDNKCKEVIYFNIENNETLEFKSLTEASKVLNINRKIIERKISDNSLYKKTIKFILKNNN